jgi:hypothetical protein
MTNQVTVSKRAIEEANWVMPVFTNESEDEAAGKLGQVVMEFEKTGNKPLGDSIRVIASALGMVLTPHDPKGPFAPLYEGEWRTAKMTDFDENFLEVLEQGLLSSSDSRIRARLADILWLRRRNISFANITIESYVKTVRHIMANVPKHKNRCPVYLIRLSQIARQIKVKDETIELIRKTFFDCINENEVEAPDHMQSRFFRAYIASGYLNDFDHWIEFANRRAEENLKKRDFRTAQDYFECALEIASATKEKNKVEQFELKIALLHEEEVSFLRETKGSAMLIQHHLEMAIKQYRKMGGYKEKAETLHKELMEVQKDVLKELGTVSWEVDRTQEINGLREEIKGKTSIDALIYLATTTVPPRIEDLKKFIIQQQRENPILSIMSHSIINDEGKTVDRKPGMTPGDETDQAGMDSEIIKLMGAHAESSGGAVYVARMDIAARYDYGEDLFDPVLVGHPLIPENRLQLFRQGFSAGLFGDYVTATHILIPQFENSLRILFEKKGILTTSLDNSLIQGERDLNTLLYYKDIGTVLDQRFIYMMRSLFVDHGSFNFRNYLAHGLISDDGFNSPVAVYIWIFLLLFFYFGSRLKMEQQPKPKPGDNP